MNFFQKNYMLLDQLDTLLVEVNLWVVLKFNKFMSEDQPRAVLLSNNDGNGYICDWC